MKKRCEFCGRKIAPCGMPMHVSVHHKWMILSKFRNDPTVILHYFVKYRRFPQAQRALPASSPLTVYSRRALGKMAAPIPELRRPKGYKLDRNYGRPADLLAVAPHYNRPIY
jgi:hypothetical protein